MSFELTDYGEPIVRDGAGDRLLITEARTPGFLAVGTDTWDNVHMSKEDWDQLKPVVDRMFASMSLPEMTS